MALFTEEQLESLKNKRDADGKIMIDESMPEDLKKAVAFVNEHNIDLFNNNINELSPEEIADTEREEELSSFTEENESEFTPIEQIDLLEIDEDISEDEVKDLDEFI